MNDETKTIADLVDDTPTYSIERVRALMNLRTTLASEGVAPNKIAAFIKEVEIGLDTKNTSPNMNSSLRQNIPLEKIANAQKSLNGASFYKKYISRDHTLMGKMQELVRQARSSSIKPLAAAAVATGVIAGGLYYVKDYLTPEGRRLIAEKKRLEAKLKSEELNRRMPGNLEKFKNSDVAKLANVLLATQDYDYFVSQFFSSPTSVAKIKQTLFDKYPYDDLCNLDARFVIEDLFLWDADLTVSNRITVQPNSLARKRYKELAAQNFVISECKLAKNYFIKSSDTTTDIITAKTSATGTASSSRAN
ncbi:MAG: hypothetical protein SGI74_06235 [Oligoflexia bacterium]|nr:hypothetical protein [Oligoflexia bacterium]